MDKKISIKKNEKLNRSYVDMHLHSRSSDGSLSEEDLVNIVVKNGLKGVSLTNHDTLLGQSKFIELASKKDIKVITGIEISSVYKNYAVHILGYGVNLFSESLLNEHLKPTWETLNDSAMVVVRRVKKLGIGIFEGANNIKKVRKLINSHSPVVSFNSLFHFIHSKTNLPVSHLWNLVFKSRSDFWRLMVKPEMLSPVEAVGLVKKMGGKSVLAHPGTICLRGNTTEFDENIVSDIISLLLENGLNGIEVYYPRHTKKQMELYQSIVKKYNLIVTAGSDFHGSYTPKLSVGAPPGLDFEDFLRLKDFCES